MYFNYIRLSWLWITTIFLLIGLPYNVLASHHKRLRGRVMVEFDHLASDADAHRDSKILLEHLQEKFPGVNLATPRVLDYKLMRAATLQMDVTKEELHESIIQAAVETGLVTDIHPLHSTVNPIKSDDTTSIPEPVFDQVLHDSPKIKNVNLLMAHALTQVDRIHEEFNNTGAGIFIAVLDDGVDYMHPALGGGFGPGYKIRYGGDFVGVPVLELNPDGSTNGKYDDDPIDDCYKYGYDGGHGTHVSGIIGAKSDHYSGVAPDATLGVWRILDCVGSGVEETFVDGMLAAHEAGADIISMSLGGPQAWPETFSAVTAERLTSAGVIVIIAAGNEGSDGAFTTNSPSVGKGALSVASFNNEYTLKDSILVNGIEDNLDVSINDTLGRLPNGADLVLGDKHTGGESDACELANISENVAGKVAIVQRGGCVSDIKVQNLAHEGAIGVLIYHNITDTTLSPYTTNATIPVVGLSARNGTTIVEAIKEDESGVKHVTVTAHVVPVASSKLVSSFSSTGPSYENDFTPNLAGVGGMVYSTYPRAYGSWKITDGTSMATPYVSGSFALYLKALRDKKQEQTPGYILEQFQNYAYKAPIANDPNVLDSAYRQGAGLVQVYDAIYQTSHVSPGSISFNDTANLIKSHTLTIVNNGDSIAWYEVNNHVSISIDPYNHTNDTSAYEFSTPAKYINGSTANIRFSRKTIKLSPGSNTTVKITVTPPASDPKLHIMYSGFIEFKSKLPNEHKDMTVPYIGIVGDQRELPIFDREITCTADAELTCDLSGFSTLNPKNESTATVIVLGLTTPSKLIVFRLYDHDTKMELGYAMKPFKYLNRSTSSIPIVNDAVWDGSYYETLPPSQEEKELPVPEKHNVKPGKYQIVAQALKLLGDPNNKSDWEDWTSNVIQVV